MKNVIYSRQVAKGKCRLVDIFKKTQKCKIIDMVFYIDFTWFTGKYREHFRIYYETYQTL